ncbi:hypothetical protein DLAC_06352 [Tieghemostelium lacteum]|uniref:Uncharacterized protein n=1 Tax=Tieghemostelium lacteum TaxID=361077 RepID=A0A151ZEJ2_TIELA|nr:hypothetical protein DLAC_06352 [Tieghemostelium lacteum]|eukprot:KYQ92382.1 hypothetical protein DLAC_06352 [Tieghemostelium lacteum]
MSDNNNNNDSDSMFGDLFLNKSYIKKTIKYFDVEIVVNVLNSASTDFDLTGQVIWPAAQVLTQYMIQKKNEHIYAGATNEQLETLELGAGAGVCGLFLSRLGKNCVLSDNNEVVLDLLRMNVEESCQRGYPCKELKIDWGDNQDIQQCLNRYPNGFDIIFGSDICYWKTSIIPLFQTVSALLSHKSTSTFLLCYQSRSTQTDQYLLEQASLHNFTYEFIDINSFVNTEYLTFKDQDTTLSIIYLIKFYRKQ